MPSTPRYTWMDDGLVASQDANLHFISAGLHYGISVFEGIRCYATDRGPAIFRLPEHVDRLRRSGLDDLAISDVIHSAAFFNWANRLMLSLGEPAAPAGC